MIVEIVKGVKIYKDKTVDFTDKAIDLSNSYKSISNFLTTKNGYRTLNIYSIPAL